MVKKIAAFGEVMMRMQVPDNKLLTQSDTLNYSFSGSGVNVLAGLNQLGHATYLISTLPDNSIGDAAIRHIQKLGISRSYINRTGDFIGMYFLEKGFGLRPSRVTYSNRLASSFNTAKEDSYNFERVASEMDVVHFCGITLAMNEVVRKQMKTLAKAVKANGGVVVFDCNYRPSLWGKDGYAKAKIHYEEMLHLADIVMMNEKDAMYVLGIQTKETKPIPQLTDLLPKVGEKYKISTIAGTYRHVLKDNRQSLQGFLFKDETFTFSKERKFTVLDRIGAGDAYTYGIIHGILKNFSTNQTVDLAVTAGILAHTFEEDTSYASESDLLSNMSGAENDLER